MPGTNYPREVDRTATIALAGIPVDDNDRFNQTGITNTHLS
jgi:hypothetical protein